ncbi:hypothetical protein [Polaribacter sp.]|uniref:hypothetical protein n=1 Tax=Polaribacter sp. TaxID=1920175 RepID=UPI003F6A8757
MKKINVFALVAAVSLVFSSCSNEENTIDNNPSSLLKTYQLKRDATGAYSVDFEFAENTKIEKNVNTSNNYNEFLFSSSNFASKKNTSQNLSIKNNKLDISFIDGNIGKTYSVSVSDDNVDFQSKAIKSKLKSYSVESIDDVTFNLNFEVRKDVNVSFVYNEEIKTYEAHLKYGTGAKQTFTKTLEKLEGEPLKIVFVNYDRIINTNAKSLDAEGFLVTRKPEVIIN